MKIVHTCLSFDYVDNMGYQENILPKMHILMGNDVSIITSTIVDRPGKKKYKKKAGSYYDENGVKIIRLKPILLPYTIQCKLRIISNVYNTLCTEKPDIIFAHEVNSLSLISVVKYIRENPSAKLFADNHNDWFNSGRNKLSLYILHKGIYRLICRIMDKYTVVFWGTLPVRCVFLKDVYGVNPKKIGFLPMGVDDTNINYNDRALIRNEIRKKYNIMRNDLLLICGGKIDRKKRILDLMEAIAELNKHQTIKLMVFGEPTGDIYNTFSELCKSCNNIIHVGWIKYEEIYKYFFASDLAVFPGLHSVLWEQAVACGIPCIFHKMDGITHVDLDGNAIFIDKINKDNLMSSISDICTNPDKLEVMKNEAICKGPKVFSYRNIAINSINPLKDNYFYRNEINED